MPSSAFFSPSGKRAPPVSGFSIVFRQQETFQTQKNSRLSIQTSRAIWLPYMVSNCLVWPMTFVDFHSGFLYALLVCFLRTSHMFLCRGKCFWVKNLAIFLVSMIDLRIRSTRKRRMCSCPHLKDFKKADGLKVFRKVHAHFVCCGSREARKRKVYPL